MVKPGTNHVALMLRDFSIARMRCAPVSPNSPRDIGVCEVMPRAMKPDCVSKSKVRQTIWRGIRMLRLSCPANAGHPVNTTFCEDARPWVTLDALS